MQYSNIQIVVVINYLKLFFFFLFELLHFHPLIRFLRLQLWLVQNIAHLELLLLIDIMSTIEAMYNIGFSIRVSGFVNDLKNSCIVVFYPR